MVCGVGAPQTPSGPRPLVGGVSMPQFCSPSARLDSPYSPRHKRQQSRFIAFGFATEGLAPRCSREGFGGFVFDMAVRLKGGALSVQGSDRWYVTDGMNAVGPVRRDLLIRGIEAGRVPLDSFVRHDTWKVWRPLADFTE